MGRIFVSYHATDGGGIARHLVDELKAAGYVDCYAYGVPGSGPEPSYDWRESLRRDLLAAEALLVVTTEESSAEWCVWEISVFRERKPDALCLEFFSGVPQGRAILDTRQAQKVVPQDPESLAAAVRTALRLLDRAGISTGPVADSPFPGLRAFTEDQASVFFGREDDIRRLAVPLLGGLRNGARAVIGPSGAGKSSLVRAGLIPQLKRDPRWIVLGPVTPAHGGVAQLASAIAGVRHGLGLDVATGPEAEACIRSADAGLAGLLGGIVAAEPLARILVCLDQTEELLLDSAEDGSLQGDAALLVGALVEATHSYAWLVYTLRADFLDQLMRHEAFTPLLMDDFLVKPLSKADLPQVVNGPLSTRGWRLDEQAMGLLQEDASGDSLPLLAFALERLWRHVNDGGQAVPRAITRAEYEASGRVQDVLRMQAEEAFITARSLVRNTDGGRLLPRDAERTVLRALRRLVSVDETGKYTRRTVATNELSDEERTLLQPFVACRVLTTTRHPGTRTEGGWDGLIQNALEVAHESLFAHWPRLHEALQRDHAALRTRRDVDDIAAQWVRFGQPADQLVPASRLMGLLTALSPSFADGRHEEPLEPYWPDLAEAMRELQFSDAAHTLVGRSLQRTADDEVDRAAIVLGDNPQDALQLLAGGPDRGDVMIRLLLHAPNLDRWRRTLQHAMAAGRRLRLLDGHAGGVWGVAWSPDDRSIATGSKDGTVRVWDTESGECMACFTHGRERKGGNPGWVRSVAWSPDGELIASAATDETVRLWSLREGREVGLMLLPDRPWSVRFDSTGAQLVVACADGGAHLWDVHGGTREPSRTLRSVNAEGEPVKLWDADISPDGRLVAAARDDGLIDLHDLADETPIRTLRTHGDDRNPPTVRSVRFEPDGQRLAVGDQGNRTFVINGDGDESVQSDRGHSDQVRRVAWSPSGRRLASASADATVLIWNVTHEADGPRDVLRLRGHNQGLCDIAWSHAGDRLVSGSDDGRARIWKVGSDPIAAIAGRGPVSAMAWCPTTRVLALAEEHSDHADPRVTPLTAPIGVIPGGATVVRVRYPARTESLAWSPDGTRLLVGSVDGTVRILQRGDGTSLHTITVLDDAHDGVHDAQWSADGALLAVASRDRTWLPRVYDRDGNLRPRGAWTTHQSFLQAAAWRPFGHVFAVAGQDNLITLNSLTSTIAEYRTEEVFTSLAWHPAGERLAVGCTDGQVLLLRVATDGTTHRIRRERESPLTGHRSAVQSVAWSPTGDQLLSASADETTRVWDARTGSQLTELIGHGKPLRQALWLDERLVATASDDGSVWCWDVTDGSLRSVSGSSQEPDPAALIQEARLRAR
ncbi:WD40 repeat domain-containing protein [Streptomyces sp. A1547]|uniref:nSTAND1 domain-containing NTPase n=1 Tax=Streptomyces sp. A1547 TaxID=2563105 RepID=UPI00109E80A6|nr:WD40 repeat domain-containing protein [Streptomyces sp. A1547]THA30535.1 hypothetical protein E6W17_37480 [Streptomyces sp. A1547]